MIDILIRYGAVLADAAMVTIGVTASAIAIGAGLGLALALMLRFRFAALALAARAYVELMRGSPVLILLFLVYYGGPSFGVVLDAVPAGILGLGLYAAAYFAEIFRAGLASVEPGQVEAARLLGLPSLSILRRIELPQIAAFILPPSINQAIIVLKDSAVLSIITVPELTKAVTLISNETFAVVAPYLCVGLIYWTLVEIVAQGGRIAERRLAARISR
ncbi:polar amino acid transport system permease protein [Methylobacterium sp. ap11]|uniref:amino acid ABC transporter permease n=1 Tax=Methylobacterium sp. ap11 TaxID=1761799 RepID=UPI0008C95238|nr:amino acid ABC transporter permease [Methylobacterium sp. ap11]SEP46346.1 polar amino acid transport system permease protein [Methylobacterium sp. ap11]